MAFDDVYVIGDSLVDAGNVLDLARLYGTLTLSDLPDGAPIPELGYFRGRFTDGYTFADLISNKLLGIVTSPVFPYGFEYQGVPIAPWAGDPNGDSLNFAYGGAQIRQGSEVVPDLDGQTDALRDARDGNFGSNDLCMVTIGGNDIRSLVPSGSDPVPQAEAYAALQACAQQLLHELGQLIDDGMENILITGIPDVGLVPRYDRDGSGSLDTVEQMRADAASDYSAYLDMLVRTQVVPALEAMGATITYVPLMDHVDGSGNLVEGGLSANLPTIAALHGLTTEELTNNLLQYQHLLFFDGLHPTAQAHALLGAYMYAQLNGTPWVETLPLTGADVDYAMTGSIAQIGEVDGVTIAMVAGTEYRFDMLGMSALGVAGSVGDTMLALLSSNGVLLVSDDDSGVGFDAALTFVASGTGNYSLQMSAVGSLVGNYLLQAAVVGGAAMLSGNSYTVNSASTLVLEGSGGVGRDVVLASTSYALAARSEIEELRTTNDRGKGAIDLTGNDFDQTIVGNAGNNVIDGKGGADLLYGGAGNDVFILGVEALAGLGQVDRIADYGRGDVVDISRILGVGSGVDIVTGGFVRIDSSGHLQVDLDGGGDQWQTVGIIDGNGSITIRYLSGGAETDLSLARDGGSSGGGGGGGGKGGGKPVKAADYHPSDGFHLSSAPWVHHDQDGVQSWSYGAYHGDSWTMLG